MQVYQGYFNVRTTGCYDLQYVFLDKKKNLCYIYLHHMDISSYQFTCLYVSSRTQNTIVPELVSLFQAGGISSPFVQSCYKFTRPNFSNGWTHTCWRHIPPTCIAMYYGYKSQSWWFTHWQSWRGILKMGEAEPSRTSEKGRTEQRWWITVRW